jgi:serine/threonine-protein phosphatase PGAM5
MLIRWCLAALTLLPVVANAAPPEPAATGRGIRYLILVRHAIYDRVDSLDDRVGNGLNELGLVQARRVGERLRDLPIRPSLFVSSDFLRARQTALEIGRVLGMTPTLDSLLHECTPTTDREDIMRSERPEDVASCESQLAAAYAKYVRPSSDRDEHDLLVCHGNVIRWLVSRAVGLDPKLWLRMETANASLTVIAVRPDGSTRLIMLNDAGHLPIDEQTWSGHGAGWEPRTGVKRPAGKSR